MNRSRIPYAGIFLTGILILISSCYKEYIIYPDYKENTFNFIVDPDQEVKIYDSRGSQFVVQPNPYLYYGNLKFGVDRFEIRGQSALNFRRKSYSVNLIRTIFFPDKDSINFVEFEKFKLLSMVFDYTYIENRISHQILSDFGLWDLPSFFTQVRLNNAPQGLYLFIEDPGEYVFREREAQCIFRRRYNHSIDKFEINPEINTLPAEYYKNRFEQIYQCMQQLTGKELYDSLNTFLRLDHYMRKMIVDLFLQNGDYTDEIFFFACEDIPGNIIFDIIPWDYDDIFAVQPHEIGRDFFVGTTFGARSYSNVAEIKQATNNRLVYSIEEDLDYKIVLDDYLYSKYLEQVGFFLQTIDETKINQYFDKLEEELMPYFLDDEIVAQLQYDANPSDFELFISNLDDKRRFLIDRINWLRNEYTNQ